MHDAVAVGVAQCLRHLTRDRQGLVNRKLGFALEPLSQRLSLHIRHHVVESPVGNAGIVQRNDVGVLQACRDLDFLQEPLGTQRGGDITPQYLDGDLTVVLLVARKVNDGHAALTEFPLDRIATFQRFSDTAEEVGHGNSFIIGPEHCRGTAQKRMAAHFRYCTEQALERPTLQLDQHP